MKKRKFLSPHRIVPVIVVFLIVIADFALTFNSTLMPNLKVDFHISDQLAQMTLGIGLFALGFSGVIYGGLSDSIGRRPIFIFSMIIFCLSALMCALAPTIEIFLIARFLQGFGSGAGWVVGNACLKDLFHGKSFARVMNFVHALAGVIPAIAPPIGSYLGALIGWRNCFWLLFGMSLVTMAAIFFIQPETLKSKKKFSIQQNLKDYQIIFKNQTFIYYSFVKVLCVMLIFTEGGNIPLIFIDYMQVPSEYYGFYIFPVFCVYILGTFLSSYLVKYLSIDTLLKIGLSCILISNVMIVIAASIHPISPMAIQALKSLSYFGWAFIFGNATAKIVSSVPKKSGLTSAIMISLEMVFSGLGIYLLGFFFNGTIMPLSWLMVITSLLCLAFMKFSPYPKQAKAL